MYKIKIFKSQLHCLLYYISYIFPIIILYLKLHVPHVTISTTLCRRQHRKDNYLHLKPFRGNNNIMNLIIHMIYIYIYNFLLINIIIIIIIIMYASFQHQLYPSHGLISMVHLHRMPLPFFLPQISYLLDPLPPKHLIKCIQYSLFSSSYLYSYTSQ